MWQTALVPARPHKGSDPCAWLTGSPHNCNAVTAAEAGNMRLALCPFTSTHCAQVLQANKPNLFSATVLQGYPTFSKTLAAYRYSKGSNHNLFSATVPLGYATSSKDVAAQFATANIMLGVVASRNVTRVAENAVLWRRAVQVRAATTLVGVLCS
jgi:hypothetical protein